MTQQRHTHDQAHFIVTTVADGYRLDLEVDRLDGYAHLASRTYRDWDSCLQAMRTYCEARRQRLEAIHARGEEGRRFAERWGFRMPPSWPFRMQQFWDRPEFGTVLVRSEAHLEDLHRRGIITLPTAGDRAQAEVETRRALARKEHKSWVRGPIDDEDWKGAW